MLQKQDRGSLPVCVCVCVCVCVWWGILWWGAVCGFMAGVWHIVVGYLWWGGALCVCGGGGISGRHAVLSAG